MRTAKQTTQETLPTHPRPLRAVVAIALEHLPETHRGNIRSICQAVKDVATASEWLQWGDLNLVAGIRAALRSRTDDGLPIAAHIGDRYVPAEQLTFPDFVTWAYEMAKRGHEMHERTREIAAICIERTGRSFDADALIAAAAASEPIEQVIERLAS